MHKLNEGKPILKGERLSKRMTELADLVSVEHGAVGAAWRDTLEHARQAGEWLVEARWRKGGARKWGRWKEKLGRECNIADRTMNLYMQVATRWDDPRITEARTQGITIESIGGFLRALKGEKPKPKPGEEGYTEPKPGVMERGKRQQWIRQAFATYLQSLDRFEMEVLDATFDDVLEAFTMDLRMRVEGSYEGPYYRYRQEYTGVHDPRIPPELPAVPSRRRVRRPKARTGGKGPEKG